MSAFLTPPTTTTNDTLALISLGREHIPAILHTPSINEKGDTEHSKEISITNTRFGSFPHSTLINLPWGSQVLASNIGALERRRGKKRKREAQGVVNEQDNGDEPFAFEAASSGFAHILPPTPENWTMSLPHRTQVVYTPDYSFILQQLCSRPGTRLIEAGAGSGSFTHASARAVFNGYPSLSTSKEADFGRVFSFEYHKPRYEALTEEIRSHGLEEIVKITHRDVYEDGFCLTDENPKVTAVFLDLPSPWLALPHLTRNTSPSPLNPDAPIHICCFSPCIEQASRTASTLRSLGYVSVTLFTIQQKQHIVRRERVGMFDDCQRGGIVFPGSVDEALDRLRMLEQRNQAFAQRRKEKMQELKAKEQAGQLDNAPNFPSDDEAPPTDGPGSRAERLRKIAEESKLRKTFLEGKVVHKTELELKTHTSFLVFAVLPMVWTEEEEQQCVRQMENGQRHE